MLLLIAQVLPIRYSQPQKGCLRTWPPFCFSSFSGGKDSMQLAGRPPCAYPSSIYGRRSPKVSLKILKVFLGLALTDLISATGNKYLRGLLCKLLRLESHTAPARGRLFRNASLPNGAGIRLSVLL